MQYFKLETKPPIRNEPEAPKSCLRAEPDIARVVELEERGMATLGILVQKLLEFVPHQMAWRSRLNLAWKI